MVFVAQIAYELFDLLPKGSFPTGFEVYKAAITAFVTTLIFYGINKTKKAE